MQILDDLGRAIVQEPTKIQVDILHPSWTQKLLIKLKIIKPYREYILKPTTLGRLILISRLMLHFDIKPFEEKKVLENTYTLAGDKGHILAEVIAIAISNSRDKPPPGLINFIIDNFSIIDINRISAIVLNNLNVTDFLSTIISLTGVNILADPDAAAKDAGRRKREISPNDVGEIIASTDLSEVSQSTSVGV